MTIRTRLNNCRTYLFILLVVLATAALLLLLTGKAASFISLNGYHSFALNVFFINYTFLGDGIFAVCLIAFCFFYKQKQLSLHLLFSFLLSSFIVQLIKNFVTAPRPKIFFEAGQYLYFIDGVTHGGQSSFPSGHTATAFTIATVFVLMLKNKNWQLPVLFAAILVGYSRIYLGQHFLIDVIAGSLIGCVSGILSTFIIARIKESRLLLRHANTAETDDETIPAPSAMQPG